MLLVDTCNWSYSSTYHTVSTKMKIIIITCRDSAEAKCRINDHKVAGSNPASEAIKVFILNDHISRTARWNLMQLVLNDRSLQDLATCPMAKLWTNQK